MSYASIMAPLAPGKDGAAHLPLAADLARRLSAYLIGTAACPLLVDASSGSATATAIVEAQQRDIETTFGALQAVFYDHAATPLREWRDKVGHTTEFIAEQARAADLIVVGTRGDESWRIDCGELLVRVGRPVLVVPPGQERLAAETVVIGWKNGPAAQRAVSGALPLLARARRVCVTGVGDETSLDDLEDVADALRRHRVHAETAWRGRGGESDAQVLVDFCAEVGSDLLVAGAYRRPRAQQWLFGGVTRELLRDQPVCRLLTH